MLTGHCGKSLFQESALRGRIALPELRMWARCPPLLEDKGEPPMPLFEEAESSFQHFSISAFQHFSISAFQHLSISAFEHFSI